MNASKVAELRQVVDELKELNEQVKELKAKREELEHDIITDMKESGMSLARTDFGTISIKESVVASVKNWDEFEQYIYDNRALYMLQRRPSEPAYREELEIKGNIPGVEPFTRITVSLTKATT